MKITSTSIYRFSISMVPFAIATGTMDYAQNTLIHIHTDSGLTGVGECSAFPPITGETSDSCFAIAQQIARLWKGKEASQLNERLDELKAIEGNYTAKSAFDIALYDLAAKAANQPLYQYLGGHYFEPESDLTIGIDTIENMAATAQHFVNDLGVNIIKVKLGKNAVEDVERIKAIRTAAGPQTRLRIDANAGWSFEDAAFALPQIQQYNIQFCEQPMAKINDDKIAALQSLTSIPLMADESVFSAADAANLTKGFKYVNIKICKAGGIREAFKIHNVCQQKSIPNMLGGMLESRVALSANVHFSLACPNVHFYDLDTCLLGHQLDPVINGVQFDGMKLKLPDLPGIGADADPAFLANCEKVEI